MDKAVLTVQVRDKAMKAKDIRRMKLIPAEYYGHGVDNVSLQMNYQDFRRLFRTAGGNTVIDLTIEGKGNKNVLVHRMDLDPVTDEIAYVEFLNVRMDEKITTKVPLRIEGTAPAVREVGAVLLQNLDELEIFCLPGDIPHEILVNVDGLTDVSMSIHVSDLKISDKIEVLTPLDSSIVSLTIPQEEVVEETPVDVSSVEVTTEKKEEGEGAEGEAAAGGEKAKEEGKKE